MESTQIPMQLLDTRQAAQFLGVESHTLAEWRCTKRYSLPYVKIGRLVKYRRDDLHRFIEENLRSN